MNKLSFEIVGQGKTVLTPLTGNTYSVKGLPNSTIEFIQDSLMAKRQNLFLTTIHLRRLAQDFRITQFRRYYCQIILNPIQVNMQ